MGNCVIFSGWIYVFEKSMNGSLSKFNEDNKVC